MSIAVENEASAGGLLSPFMRPVIYFSVSGAGAVTAPTAEIEFDGTTEDVTFEAIFLRTASTVHYFAVDLSQVMKYLMKSFDGGSYPDDLEFINGNLLQKFDEYFRSLTMDIYFERGTANQQTIELQNYWIYLANQLPYSGGFRLDNVVNHSCMGPLKWAKNTYNALFFWCGAGNLSITKPSGVPDVTEVVYGLHYNYYAATDVRNITSSGWHIPTFNDWRDLIYYLDPSRIGLDPFPSIAGGKLKEAGLTYWNTPNTDATNEVGFNGRGGGSRSSSDGSFSPLKIGGIFWGIGSGYALGCQLTYNNNNVIFNALNVKSGIDIRPIKDSTLLTNGQTGTYTGNDGKVYRTICIGTQEWLVDNLCETKYRNGDNIPEVTDNAAWAALTTGALCASNNDWTNAFVTTSADSGSITADDTLTVDGGLSIVGNTTIYSGVVTEGYYQYKFSKLAGYLDRGLNAITITTPGGTKTIIINYDPDCADVIPVMWQHPLLGYVSFPFNGNKVTNVTGRKRGEIDIFRTTMVNTNSLKEILGYDETRKLTITTKVDAAYWPLLASLYSSRHVYLFVGADGVNDTAGSWVECEVSGGCSYRSDRVRGTFAVELTLPETFNVRF